MGAQTSILPYGQPVGFAGQATKIDDAASAVNKEVTAAIGYGLGVKPGVNVKEVLLPTAAISIFDGVLLNDMVDAPGSFGNISPTATPPGIVPATMGTLLKKGRCFVVVDGDAAVTPNVTRFYWRWQSDGVNNTLVGTFRDADPGDGRVVDTRKQILAIGPIFTSADGTSKICEAYISAEVSA